MPDNTTFSFNISVSQQHFTTKPPKGDDVWKQIYFTPQEFTVETLLQAVRNGKVFCGTFKSDKPDSSFSISEKKKRELYFIIHHIL